MRARVFAIVALGFAGCRQDMHDQPRYEAFERSETFADRRSARLPIAGTVARGHLRDDELLETGRRAEGFSEVFPFPITAEIVDRGQDRYQVYCTPCHGRAGHGDGLIVQRGLRRPPSFHIDRLRGEKPGYLFDVITRGFGAMPDYAAQITPKDRWAVVAYLRALQLSQNARLADVPPAERDQLAEAP
jgi:cbb3-type cytochrome c oxidase subunit III